MKPIPFCDLSRAHAPIAQALQRAMVGCLDRSTFLRGSEALAFDEEWAAYCGQAHAVCCNSGTDALTLGAMVLGIKTAAVQSNTLPLTAIGLYRGGSRVCLQEVGSDGWMINAPAAPKAGLAGPDSTPEPVPVLMFGQLPPPGAQGARFLDQWLAERQFIGERYNCRLRPMGIALSGDTLHHLYVVRVPARDSLVTFLAIRGIGSKVHWATALHQQPGPWEAMGRYEQAERWCASVLSLPCFPGLRSDEIDRTCDAIEAWFSGHQKETVCTVNA